MFTLCREELDTLTVGELWQRFADTSAALFDASAAAVFLPSDGEASGWRVVAANPPDGAPDRALKAVPSKKLAVPRKLTKDAGAAESLLLATGKRKWISAWSVPLLEDGKVAALMQFEFQEDCDLLPRDRELLTILGARCLAAAARLRLLDDIAARERRMREMARRMLQIQEIDRRRVSRELHDKPGQDLVVVRLQLEMIEQTLPEGAEERTGLGEVRELIEKTILEIRRLIADLSPAVLEQLGVAAGMRQLVNRFRRGSPARVHLHIGKLPALDKDFEITVYRLAQECLSNVARHSSAEHVNISLTAVDRVLRLLVQDDGVGFEVEEGIIRKQCFGLIGMRERISLLGGDLKIESTRNSGEKTSRTKSSGTKIEISLPVVTDSSGTSTAFVVR